MTRAFAGLVFCAVVCAQTYADRVGVYAWWIVPRAGFESDPLSSAVERLKALGAVHDGADSAPSDDAPGYWRSLRTPSRVALPVGSRRRGVQAVH